MARAGLGWSIDDLAAAAKVGRATVARFELGNPVADATRAALQGALEQAGAVFSESGVTIAVAIPKI